MKKEEWYHYIADDGQPEAVNYTTGEVARLDIPQDERDDYVLAAIDGRKVFVHKDTVVPTTQLVVQYNGLVAEHFCSNIAEGATLKKACMAAGISYTTLCKWRRQYPEFRKMLEEAHKDRGELYFERLVDVAETTPADKEEVPLGRLKADIYKHLSAVSNEKFNLKTKLESEHKVGIIRFDTGVDRTRTVGEEEAVFKEALARQTGTKEQKEK
jgi:transposase-like protein